MRRHIVKSSWHQHMVRVHYQDTDQMGVAHHANYVSWFEISRTEMMRETGITYRDMENLGLLLPVVDMNVKYLKPAHYDEHLAIFTKVVKVSPVRLELDYEVRRIKDDTTETKDEHGFVTPHGELLATGNTSHMWINTQWKVTRLDKAAPEVYQMLLDKK